MARLKMTQELFEEVAALAMHGFLHTAMIEARQSGADERSAQREAWEQFCHVAPHLSEIAGKAAVLRKSGRKAGERPA